MIFLQMQQLSYFNAKFLQINYWISIEVSKLLHIKNAEKMIFLTSLAYLIKYKFRKYNEIEILIGTMT